MSSSYLLIVKYPVYNNKAVSFYSSICLGAKADCLQLILLSSSKVSFKFRFFPAIYLKTSEVSLVVIQYGQNCYLSKAFNTLQGL